MSAPEPIATGTLAKTALPHLLVYLEQKKLSGTLAIWPDDSDTGAAKKPDRVLLLKGVPVAGSLTAPATSLREGLLHLFTRTSAPYAFYGANLLGDDRLSARVDPFSLIAESLRSTARDDVVREVVQRFGKSKLAVLPDLELARYDLQPEELALINALQKAPAAAEHVVSALSSTHGVAPVRALRLVYLLAITKAVESVSAPASAPVPPAPIGVEPRSAAPAEHAGSRAAPPPRPPVSARAAEKRGADTATLVETDGFIDPADLLLSAPPEAPSTPASAPGSVPAAAGSTPPSLSDAPGSAEEPTLHGSLDRLQSIPPPPDSLDDELRQRWLRVVTKGRLIENQNYFEMLDLDKEVKSSDARAKYFQVAKEWHPDRLPALLAPLREYVQIIFSYMSDANTTLGDDVQRAKYLQTVREGGGTPATDRLMQAILDTAMEYERVLVMARRHQYDEAIALMVKILAVVKEDAEYHAMYASLLLQKFAAQATEGELRQVLESVDRALELYDRHEKANLLKGQILRRLGRQSEALTFFKRVAEINPRNIDAMREVRVATMRAGSGAVDGKTKRPAEEQKRSGLFGKLFKKE